MWVSCCFNLWPADVTSVLRVSQGKPYQTTIFFFIWSALMCVSACMCAHVFLEAYVCILMHMSLQVCTRYMCFQCIQHISKHVASDGLAMCPCYCLLISWQKTPPSCNGETWYIQYVVVKVMHFCVVFLESTFTNSITSDLKSFFLFVESNITY